jgi:tRNA-splicing ligase RtcB
VQFQGRPFVEAGPFTWELSPVGAMRAAVRVVATRSALAKACDDGSIAQACAVAELPGVLSPVLAMPDVHQGYGFPIGGVAAFDETTGVVSPGGVGYDINCGVRMLSIPLPATALAKKRDREALADALARRVPAGVGVGSKRCGLGAEELDRVLEDGIAWAVAKGFASTDDAERSEDGGRLRGADPSAVSAAAKERGRSQLGTLGSGNHFVEIQAVEAVYDAAAAATFGIEEGGLVAMVHTGSRGLGYQVCADALDEALDACRRYGIALPNRSLAAAPLDSPEGKRYLAAMTAAANFAFANRAVCAAGVREALEAVLGVSATSVSSVYDVCHNIAKWEEHPGPRGSRRVCVHRKGATRAFPPGHPAVTARYRAVGQPVLVPGDMGRASYVQRGLPGALEKSFGSSCHGAGRELSRTRAKEVAGKRAIVEELAARGIVVRAEGRSTVTEEMPEAYKDVTSVVEATEGAGLTARVARLVPLVVVKG